MAVISVSLPDDLLARADRLIDKRGFKGRSDVVRASLRDFLLAQDGPEGTGKRSATLTLVYPEGHEREFSKVRHLFGDVIRTMIHGHAGETCVEVFVLEGKHDRLHGFADALRATRTAHQVTLTPIGG